MFCFSEVFLNSPSVYRASALISTFSKAISSMNSAFCSILKFLSDLGIVNIELFGLESMNVD